jgi:phage gp36-like protein
MPYCTIDDIKKVIPAAELIQLTDDSQTGEVDTDIVNAAIANADNLINGYLRAKYSLPLSEVPDLVKEFSVTLAKHWLYSRRWPELPDGLKDAYKNAFSMLKDINAGKLTLGIDETTTDTTVDQAESQFYTNKTTADRVFNATLLDTY